eukprot:gene5308-3810_t
MKLPERQRKPSADYLLDNAASLRLGYLFLGWKKKRSKKTSRIRKVKSIRSTIAKVRKGRKAFSQQKNKLRKKVLPQPTPPPVIPARSLDETINVTVCFVNGETISLRSSLSTTVFELQQQVECIGLLPQTETRLFANGGRLLPQGGQLGQLGILDGAVVFCLATQ